MKIELKNIKHSQFASEETNCFQATIYVNGKKAGGAKNDGNGGQTHIWWDNRDLGTQAEAHVAALPEETTVFGDQEFTMKPTIDSFVDDLLMDHLIAKDFKRDIKNRLLFTKKGESGVSQTKRIETASMQRLIGSGEERVKEALKVQNIDQILNFLPADEALKIYRKQVA